MTEIKITVPGVAAPKSIRIIMRNGHPSMANNKKVQGLDGSSQVGST
jgi:hypothetical protein